MGAKCAVHKDENCFPFDPTWAQDVSVKERNVTVMSTVPSCDVTYFATTSKWFNKHIAKTGLLRCCLYKKCAQTMLQLPLPKLVALENTTLRPRPWCI